MSNGIEHHVTRQEEEEQVCGEHLGGRFSLGKRAPLNAHDLREEIGDLSDAEAARRISENEYVFSEKWDPATVDLLKAAARIRVELDKIQGTDSDVTVDDFRSFWGTSKERTSSSKSGWHFGHYRAVTEDQDLMKLHVANINLAA